MFVKRNVSNSKKCYCLYHRKKNDPYTLFFKVLTCIVTIQTSCYRMITDLILTWILNKGNIFRSTFSVASFMFCLDFHADCQNFFYFFLLSITFTDVSFKLTAQCNTIQESKYRGNLLQPPMKNQYGRWTVFLQTFLAAECISVSSVHGNYIS